MPTIMFHGTSGVKSGSILSTGLDHTRSGADRVSHRLARGIEDHLASLDGIYLAASPDTALSYARKAVEALGGQPLIVAVLVDEGDAVPDEDTLLEFIGNYITDLPALWPNERDFLGRWRADDGFRAAVSGRLAADFRALTAPVWSGQDAAAFQRLLAFAFAPMDPEHFALCTEERGPHLTPNFLDPALNQPGGGALYREIMDALCHAYRGPGPYDDAESHTVRVPGAIGYTGATRIVGVGTLEHPFAVYQPPATSLAADGLAEALAAAGLALPGARPAAAPR